MNVYLVRHGDATPEGFDDDRVLTSRGITESRKLAEFIRHRNLQVEHVLYSKKIRAKQTAELVLTGMKFHGTAEVRDDLDPMSSVSSISKFIHNCDEDILIVGHMPYLGKLVSHLVADVSSDLVIFRKGAMVCLEQAEGLWAISWMLTPDIL